MVVEPNESDQQNREAAICESMEIRCPKLGGQVNFAYCRREGGRLPCQRALVCWRIYFPVDAYLKARMTADEWQHCFECPPKSRIAALMECIDEAKKRVEGKGS